MGVLRGKRSLWWVNSADLLSAGLACRRSPAGTEGWRPRERCLELEEAREVGFLG